MSRFKDLMIEVEHLASLLAAGDSTDHYICPTCKGGQSGEKSFVVWKAEEGLTYGWMCYRNSCSEKGVRHGGQPFTPSPQQKKRTIKPFTGQTTRLTRLQEKYLHKMIGFSHIHRTISGVKYHSDSQRFVFPINDSFGERRGVVLRTYNPRRGVKAVNRMDKLEPAQSWYLRHGTAPLFIVEDIPSAVRLSVYTNALALCGTAVPQNYLSEIIMLAEDVVWIFDNDATGKAMEYARNNRLLFNNSVSHIITKDVKNMSEVEVQDLVTRLLRRIKPKVEADNGRKPNQRSSEL